MKECLSEGSLRAYYDNELLPADKLSATRHLAECASCRRLSEEVAARAAWVGRLMSVLPESETLLWTPRPPRPVRPWSHWVAAVSALAACLAIGVVSLPGPTLQPVRGKRVLALAGEASNGPSVLPENVFLALDDEPIEAGYVVRVALGEAEVPADVVLGKDGRARAIRLVGNPFVQ